MVINLLFDAGLQWPCNSCLSFERKRNTLYSKDRAVDSSVDCTTKFLFTVLICVSGFNIYRLDLAIVCTKKLTNG